MLKLCLVIWISEPEYAYKRYAYRKTCITYSRSAKINKSCWLIFKQRRSEMSSSYLHAQFKLDICITYPPFIG